MAVMLPSVAHARVPYGNISQTSRYKRPMSKEEALTIIKRILPFHEPAVVQPHDYCFPVSLDEDRVEFEWRICVGKETTTSYEPIWGGLRIVTRTNYHHDPGRTQRVEFKDVALIVVMPEVLGTRPRRMTPGRTFLLFDQKDACSAIFSTRESEAADMAAALLALCPNLKDLPSGAEGLKALRKLQASSEEKK